MRFALFIAAAVMALSATVAAPAHAFTSNNGQASASANVRSGPSGKYEIIGKLRSGQRVEIIGCARTWEWCDVKSSDKRGWVAAKFLLGHYDNHLAGVINYGPKMGVQVISFDEPAYWSAHYSHTYFYQKRYGMRNATTAGPRTHTVTQYNNDSWDNSEKNHMQHERTSSNWHDIQPSDQVRINN